MSDQTARRAELLEQRYGIGREPKGIIWNDQVEHMMKHRSVRKYRTDPLPEGALETMVAAAQSASTSSNLHMWSVIAVTDPVIKSDLYRTSGHGNPFIEIAPVFLLWVADQSRNNSISKANGGSAIVHEHLDAFVMATIDTALAAQNAALAAESLGLGTVYIGGMRNKSKEVADLLNLPNYSYVTFGMAVGYPAQEAYVRLRPRPSQEVVLHRNYYESDRAVRISDYEEPFKSFREELGMKDKTFVEAVGFSANDLRYMDGREKLRHTVEGRGFKLR